MKKRATVLKILSLGAVALAFSATSVLAQPVVQEVESFPRALDSYAQVGGLWLTLRDRVSEEPFNFVATLIFLLAVIHTFLTSSFLRIAERKAVAHDQRIERGEAPRDSVDHTARLLHFLGEVEVVFGLWAVALVVAIVAFYDWSTAVHYLGHTVDFTEAAFVVQCSS